MQASWHAVMYITIYMHKITSVQGDYVVLVEWKTSWTRFLRLNWVLPSSSPSSSSNALNKTYKGITRDRKFLFNGNSIHNFARVRGTNFPSLRRREGEKNFYWMEAFMSKNDRRTTTTTRSSKLYIQRRLLKGALLTQRSYFLFCHISHTMYIKTFTPLSHSLSLSLSFFFSSKFGPT